MLIDAEGVGAECPSEMLMYILLLSLSAPCEISPAIILLRWGLLCTVPCRQPLYEVSSRRPKETGCTAAAGFLELLAGSDSAPTGLSWNSGIHFQPWKGPGEQAGNPSWEAGLMSESST